MAEAQILDKLGLGKQHVVDNRDGMLMIEIPVEEKDIPPSAEYLRFHSTNLAALMVALKFGKGLPPPRLAVGFAETKPAKSKVEASPGLYFSETAGGSLTPAPSRLVLR